MSSAIRAMPIALNITDSAGVRQVVLGNGSVVVGGGDGCEVPLADPTVSRRHLRLEITASAVRVEDLGSTNGSTLDGALLQAGVPMTWGPKVALGLGDTLLAWSALTDEDESPVVELAAPARLVSDRPEAEATQRGATHHPFLSKRLPALLELATTADALTLGRAVGEALAEDSSVAALVIEEVGEPPPATLFRVGTVDDAVCTVEHGRFRAAADGEKPDFAALLGTALRVLALAAEGTTSAPERRAPTAPPAPATLEPAVQRLYDKAAQAARAGLNVLIQGETGAGKEVLARYIREEQASEGGWVTINCAALPESLLEAELFGIEKGVATGVEARAGHFERAHGGVLFLDEIADMSLGTQAQILRVIEERRVRRVGGETLRPAEVQLVAASNRPLRDLVEDGSFRRDLFHRLADWEAVIPSLADRPRDIANLASHFLSVAAQELRKPIRGLTQGAVTRLLAHDWPGNVRELQREMHRVAAFAPDHAVITASDLGPAIGADHEAAGDLASQVLRYERRIIARALAATDDDVDAAAESLGISRSTLYRRLRATGLGSTSSQD